MSVRAHGELGRWLLLLLCQLHEELLSVKARAIACCSSQFGGLRTGIGTVGAEQAGPGVVAEVRVQDFVKDTPAQIAVFHRKHDFDAFVEIAGHPVGAAEINVRRSSVLEIENAAVFEESADDAAHTNAVAQAFDIRAQSA